jgi:phosphohistidine phosphatase
MKTLLILRHAKSSWKDVSLADHDRPLNKRGKRDAPRMGKLLREQDLVPDRIISSTAKRARNTAKAVAKACDCEDKVELTSEFYHAGPGAYLAVLQNVSDDDQRVMVVGHNPGMEALVTHLTGRMETMPTAALAHVALPIEKWDELDYEVQGELLHLWRPKALTSE